jgi:hypothetical protein
LPSINVNSRRPMSCTFMAPIAGSTNRFSID